MRIYRCKTCWYIEIHDGTRWASQDGISFEDAYNAAVAAMPPADNSGEVE